MLGHILKNTLFATALFSVLAFVLIFTRNDTESRVHYVVTFPLLIIVAAVATLIIEAIAGLGSWLARESLLVAVCVSAILGWWAAGGGYQSFGGLGAYSDLIQPAFAVSLAVPWLIQAIRNTSEV